MNLKNLIVVLKKSFIKNQTKTLQDRQEHSSLIIHYGPLSFESTQFIVNLQHFKSL